jgi:hypothetical protein
MRNLLHLGHFLLGSAVVLAALLLVGADWVLHAVEEDVARERHEFRLRMDRENERVWRENPVELATAPAEAPIESPAYDPMAVATSASPSEVENIP